MWSTDCNLWTTEGFNSDPIRFNNSRKPKRSPCEPLSRVAASAEEKMAEKAALEQLTASLREDFST